MTDTPKQVIPIRAPEGGDLTETHNAYSGALDPQLAELNEAVKARVSSTLDAYGTVLTRLRIALETHAINIEEGSLEHRELGSDLKHFLPILTATLHQENKVHETIEQRVGRAGQYALDLSRARSEIHGRLAGILRARGSEHIPERPE